MGTLKSIFKDNWEWRGQIWRLAVFELKKQQRGAAFGWGWFLVKPIIYVFCFWFALDVGMRGAKVVVGDGPYIVWLAAGIIPWFFMSNMLGGGVDVLRKFSYLVKKVKFPICAIPSIYTLSTLFIQLIQYVVLFAVYFATGQPLDLYLLQFPVLVILMTMFWWLVSLLISPLCAMSRDMKNLMNALSTPFFWLSGVIFDVHSMNSVAIHTALLFNPITFFVTGFRDALFLKVWIWDDPMTCICFAGVFLVTAVLALIVYKKTNREVADVL